MNTRSMMKAVLLSFLFVLIFNYFSLAQATWNLSGSDAYYNNGSVGIGTSSPSRKFVVSNGGALGLEIDPTANSGTVTEFLSYDRSLSMYKPIHFYASTYQFTGGPSYFENLRLSGNVIEEYQNDVDGGIGSVNINYRGYNGGTTRFRNFLVFDGKMNSIIEVTGATQETKFNGIVGIGTTSSLYALNVERASSIIRVASVSGTNGTRIQFENNAGPAYVGLDNSSGGLGGAYSLNMWHGGNYPIVFGTNNTEKAKILADGKFLLGISSTINNDLMQVNGRGHFAGRVSSNHSTAEDNNAAFFNNSSNGYGFYSKGGGGSRYALSINDYNENNLLVVSGTGNVGIGTTTPTSKLTVAGNIDLSAESGGTGIIYLGKSGATAGLAFDNDYPNYGIFYTEGTPDYVSISPNGGGSSSPVAYFGGDGKVGIGTETPQNKFDVKTATNSVVSFASPLNVGEYSGVHFGYSEAGSSAYRKTAIVYERTGTHAEGKIHLLNNIGHNSNSATLADAKLTISDNGYVGIGTTNPDQALTVNGKIHAKELKIDLSIPAPDYVFEKDYHLRSLNEVEEFIKINKHLPEVPSAKEMAANGVNTGEMNMLLLKKVEELTLYIIELKAEVEKLKSEK